MRLALLAVLVPALAHGDKLADAPKTIVDAIAKIELKHARFGEALVIAQLEPGDVDATALRAALAKAKLKILDDRMHGTQLVITVEGSHGARATIAADAGGGTVTLTARPRLTKPAGACVPVPDVKHPVTVRSRAIDQRGQQRLGETFWDFKTERVHDVDGDGIADAFVPVAKKNACPEQVSYRIFAVRGSCGHDLGVIGPGTFAFDAGTTALDPSGFRPFTMEAQTNRVGKRMIVDVTTTTRRFAVGKSGKYAQVSIDTKTSSCHHCATWSCVSPP